MLIFNANAAVIRQPSHERNYEIEEFTDKPGIYFEKIGQLHYSKSAWKLVIKLNLATINERQRQIKKYIVQTQNMCGLIPHQEHHQTTCVSLGNIARQELEYLQKTTNQINTIYKNPVNKRRGIINGIGSISKALFGTMDADDEKRINEQLELIQNNQKTTQHALHNQLTVINDTITHLSKIESTIEHNEKLLQGGLIEYITLEEIQQRFEIITTILTDLIRNAENILDYLAYMDEGKLHPKLSPVDNIIAHLKEATPQLEQGSYFPFKAHTEDWREIKKHAKVSAYSDENNIFTIIRFPIISQPTYELINVIEFPTPSFNKTFKYIQVENSMFAIDKEKLTYLLITKANLHKCNKINSHYICSTSMPIYRINTDIPCELQMYTQHNKEEHDCKIRYRTSKPMLLIELQQPHTWLYATTDEKTISIECNKQRENNRKIKNTGKLTLRKDCKFTTKDVTIETKATTYVTDIDTYLPEINITSSQDENTKLLDSIDNLTQHGIELIELKTKINNINNNIQDSENNFYLQKQFIYPMVTSIAIMTITIALVTWVITKSKRERQIKRRPSVTILDDDWSVPRSILKRSKSTRF